MRLVAEHLVLALPSLIAVRSYLCSFLLSRHPVRPFLIRSCSINLTSLPTPTPILLFLPSYFITSILLLFSSSSCSYLRQHPLRLSVRPNTPTSRITIPKAVYISLRIDRFSSQPILVPIAFWLYQVRNPPLHPHLESSI